MKAGGARSSSSAVAAAMASAGLSNSAQRRSRIACEAMCWLSRGREPRLVSRVERPAGCEVARRRVAPRPGRWTSTLALHDSTGSSPRQRAGASSGKRRRLQRCLARLRPRRSPARMHSAPAPDLQHVRAIGVRAGLRGLLAGSSWFDAIVDSRKAAGLPGLWRQVRELRQRRCDLAVVFPNSIETGLVPFLARVPLRLGYRQGRPGLMNLGLKAKMRRRWFERRLGPRRWPSPMPQYYRQLLDCLGIPGGAVHPQLAVTADERQWLDAHLQQLGIAASARLALFVVGANFGGSKLWPPERFAAVARHLHEQRGMTSLVVVGPAELELGKRIGELAGVPALTDPVLS